MARQLLADAGVEGGLQATLHAAELQEIPELAQLIQAGAAEAGINLELAIESLDTFYGAQWCPAEPADPPCSGAAELGIVDYGHRPTPDVFLNAALADERGLELVAVLQRRRSTTAFAAFQEAVGVDAQTEAAGSCRRSSTTRCRSACRSSTTTCPVTRTASRASGCRRSGRCSPRRRRRSERSARTGQPMTRYVIRRLALSILTLFLLATIVFLIVNVLPTTSAAASSDRSRRRRRSTR